MVELVLALVAVFTILVFSWVLRTINSIWLKPMKLQRYLSEQGIGGPSYKLIYGNLKEEMGMSMNALFKPMDFSHSILPRVIPFLQQTVKKYGKLSVIWYGPTARVYIMDPDHIKDAFSNKDGHLSKRISPLVTKFLVAGLVSYDGEKWAKHRRIVNPAFHLEQLKMMLPAFYSSCCEMVCKWQKLIPNDSGELDIWPEFQNLTGDVISRTAFGSNYEKGRRIFELQTEQAELIIQALQAVSFPGSRFLPTKRNRRMKEIHKETVTLLRDMVNRREKAMEIGETINNDLLGMLVESNVKEIHDGQNSKKFGMSIDEVIEECKLFFFAGKETTSTLLTWTMILLSKHADWQSQAREEVLQVFGKGKPDFDGLSRLNIVTMILYEVLRLYPPVAMLVRATDKTLKLGNVSLPAGMEIALPTLLIHHDRELWGEDVEQFNPRRFADGISKATKNKVSFFPFGWGPRICVGQTFAMLEAKMALALILQTFSFDLSPTYVHAPYTVITLQPQHGAQLILHKL